MNDIPFICHRINTIASLEAVDPRFGVELDLHSFDSKIVVHHDPMQPGVEFRQWLTTYRHSFLIANIKQEGIEAEVLKCLAEKSIVNFFLLDTSFPVFVRLAQKGMTKIALRLSKFESIETAFKMAGMADWIWIDLFDDQVPISAGQWLQLQKMGFKICLVSPELHGRTADSVENIKNQLKAMNAVPDAICGKSKTLW